MFRDPVLVLATGLLTKGLSITQPTKLTEMRERLASVFSVPPRFLRSTGATASSPSGSVIATTNGRSRKEFGALKDRICEVFNNRVGERKPLSGDGESIARYTQQPLIA